jgi:hypothetical protein
MRAHIVSARVEQSDVLDHNHSVVFSYRRCCSPLFLDIEDVIRPNTDR